MFEPKLPDVSTASADFTGLQPANVGSPMSKEEYAEEYLKHNPDAEQDRDRAYDMASSALGLRRSAVGLREDADVLGHYTGSAEEMIIHARGSDQKASRIEKWGGILHDHPVSPEYQAKCDFELSAETLEGLERRSMHYHVAIEHLREQIRKRRKNNRLHIELLTDSFNAHVPANIDLSGIVPPSGSASLFSVVATRYADSIGDPNAYATKCRELAAQKVALLRDSQTTLEQIETFYQDLLYGAYIQPLEDDIKSGRASSPSPQPEAA
jgi:hypothetical protein